MNALNYKTRRAKRREALQPSELCEEFAKSLRVPPYTGKSMIGLSGFTDFFPAIEPRYPPNYTFRPHPIDLSAESLRMVLAARNSPLNSLYIRDSEPPQLLLPVSSEPMYALDFSDTPMMRAIRDFRIANALSAAIGSCVPPRAPQPPRATRLQRALQRCYPTFSPLPPTRISLYVDPELPR